MGDTVRVCHRANVCAFRPLHLSLSFTFMSLHFLLRSFFPLLPFKCWPAYKHKRTHIRSPLFDAAEAAAAGQCRGCAQNNWPLEQQQQPCRTTRAPLRTCRLRFSRPSMRGTALASRSPRPGRESSVEAEAACQERGAPHTSTAWWLRKQKKKIVSRRDGLYQGPTATRWTWHDYYKNRPLEFSERSSRTPIRRSCFT